MFSGFLPSYNTSFNLSLEMSDDPVFCDALLLWLFFHQPAELFHYNL